MLVSYVLASNIRAPPNNCDADPCVPAPILWLSQSIFRIEKRAGPEDVPSAHGNTRKLC